ncbi:2-phosphosulfolactate phosphatase [Actinophytocola sediminis]
MTVYAQDGYDLRVEWGSAGVRALGQDCAVLVVVDVLVFTTSVDIVLGRGGRVLALPWRDERGARLAAEAGATLVPAGLTGLDGARLAADRSAGWSLRPSSLDEVPAGTFLGIASPNGATLCAAAARTGATVLAGCLRNASAVAAAAHTLAAGGPVGVVAAGERWRDIDDRPLRPSIEDWLGAGAIAAAVAAARPSPEAELAAMTFRAAGERLPALVAGSVSGRELIAADLPGDVALASDVDVSEVVPVLADGVLVRA